jgi:hypothetical protein
VANGGELSKQALFIQNVVAIIWDFDKTLIPTYMQAPLFKHYGVDEKKFWKEVNGLGDLYRTRGAVNISADTLYLNHILTYVREGIFKGLTNAKLKSLGNEIEFYAGLPDFFELLKKEVATNAAFQKYEISIEHYIVSTGLRTMIEGSRIAKFVDGIWGCEFIQGNAKPDYLDKDQRNLFPDSEAEVITDIVYSIDNTTKTRALFEINKGSNKDPKINVNASLAPEDRRIPFQNMIYIADGPSDVPAFSILNQYGGHTFAVYKPGVRDQFNQANRLLRENRVQGMGEANYEANSQTSFWISEAVAEITTRIATARETLLSERIGRAPQHILTDIPDATKSIKTEQMASAPKMPPASALPEATISEMNGKPAFSKVS